MSKSTKKVVKETSRLIGDISLSKKENSESKAMITVIKTLKSDTFYTYEFLKQSWLKELALISKSKSNLKTRFDRLLYRSIESGISRGSIQGLKFNLVANYKGLSIKSKEPVIFKSDFNAELKTVVNNEYSFKKSDDIVLRDNYKPTEAMNKRVLAFQLNNQ
jgi:hypothetical protein